MTFGVERIDHDTLYDYKNTVKTGATGATATLAANTSFEITEVGDAGDVSAIATALSITTAEVVVGLKFTTGGSTITGVDGGTKYMEVTNNLTSAPSAGKDDTDVLTAEIEAIQAKINTARVQAGSQYAAIESAVNYTTDLTAQYELGYNTVNDVNFSMETAHLAKNQILQQAATAMLAQANSGQQGLLQLIQG
jgi:flagellin